jgi:hypothetical protein
MDSCCGHASSVVRCVRGTPAANSQFKKEFPTAHNAAVSKHLGRKWNEISAEEKQYYMDKAREVKSEHLAANPGYKYCPRRRIPVRSANCFEEGTPRSATPPAFVPSPPNVPPTFTTVLVPDISDALAKLLGEHGSIGPEMDPSLSREHWPTEGQRPFELVGEWTELPVLSPVDVADAVMADMRTEWQDWDLWTDGRADVLRGLGQTWGWEKPGLPPIPE